MYRAYLTSVFFLLLLSISGRIIHAQDAYDVRLQLAVLDTSTRTACYDLELANTGNSSWILANYNFGIFYDASILKFRSDSLLLDDVVYDQGITLFETSLMGSPLPYEDSLGFIRLSLAANMEGNVMGTNKAWLATIRVCFDILIDDITSPNTCASFNFNSSELSSLIGVPPNIVQSWISFSTRNDIDLNTAFDVIPNRSRNSCFVMEENTEELCSDGIDNDEDGLMDCEDITGCASGILPIRISAPDCIDTLGGIQIVNGTPGLAYSFDGGVTFSSDSVITDIAAGTYNVVVTRNGIASCAFRTPVTIPAPDCQEFDDITCSDGIDNDGDGLIDCDDPSCAPLLQQIVIDQPMICPELTDGSILLLSLYDSIRYSIDGGNSYMIDGDFIDLGEGAYNIRLSNTITTCESAPIDTLIILSSVEPCPVPQENCRDGVDNDQDGLVDCQDPDCSSELACNQFPAVYFPNVIMRTSATNNTFGASSPSTDFIIIQDLTVYDRWGGKVYEVFAIPVNDQSHRWNGRSRFTNEYQAGVYSYVATLVSDTTSKVFKGDLTLL